MQKIQETWVCSLGQEDPLERETEVEEEGGGRPRLVNVSLLLLLSRFSLVRLCVTP